MGAVITLAARKRDSERIDSRALTKARVAPRALASDVGVGQSLPLRQGSFVAAEIDG